MPKISVYRGRNHLFDHWIETAEVVIGRSVDAHIPLDSPAASRRHCRIVRREGSYILEELGAKNGLFVNGQYCTVRRLEDGDTIEIADHVLSFSRPRSEIAHESALARNQQGAAFRITSSQVDRAMSEPADSQGLRQDLQMASATSTTAVSPAELERLLAEMQTKLSAHVEVLGVEGQHLRIPLEENVSTLGFGDGVDISLGKRFWPWGREAARIRVLTTGEHAIERASRWVRIRVGEEDLKVTQLLEDGDKIRIGGSKLRYMGRTDVAK